MLISFLSPAKKYFLLSFAVLLFLSGCGGHAPSARPYLQKPSPSPVACHGSTSASTSRSAPLGTSVAFDLGGCIHIQSESGFTCDAGAFTPPGLLVLPTVRPTYDQGTIQSVQNYLSGLYKNPGDGMTGTLPHHRDTVPYPPFSADPQAFQLLPVGGCDEFLQISNISSTLLQITLASVILTADSQVNTQHYNLVEGCSLLSLAPGCEGSLGGGGGIYTVSFDLQPGKENQVIPAAATGNQLTNSFVLQAGEVAEVILSYDSLAPINFSFSLVPSLLVGQHGEGGILNGRRWMENELLILQVLFGVLWRLERESRER